MAETKWKGMFTLEFNISKLNSSGVLELELELLLKLVIDPYITNIPFRTTLCNYVSTSIDSITRS